MISDWISGSGNLRLMQYRETDGQRRVGLVSENEAELHVLAQFETVYEMALAANRMGVGLASLVMENLSRETAVYDDIIQEKRVLPPLDHPDPAHCIVTGTGLTHVGSAQARDEMHTKEESAEPLTDSMRMFQWGLQGGKPPPGKISVQPEWFYKGNGHCVVAPERALPMPPFALDGGEEPELVGLYVIGDSSIVLRVGFALGNEFSDHVMERQNYLYLAHSKLRPCAFGPELIIGEIPADIQGTVRIWRGGKVLWQRPFLTGEANMSYTLAGLEHHHFKYAQFRQPGDVHCHFFGTSTLSFADGIETQPHDLFEIEAPGFGRPLRNPLQAPKEVEEIIRVQKL